MNELWYETNDLDRFEIASRFRQIPVVEWGLSIRVRNALLRHNPAMSIGDVAAAGPEMADIKGLGAKAFRELHAKVSELIENPEAIGDYLPSETSTTGPDGIEQHSILPHHVLELSVDLLQLDKGTRVGLLGAGLHSIGELARTTDAGRKPITGSSLQNQQSIAKVFDILFASVSQEGEVDWVRYYHTKGIRLIPSHLPEPFAPADIIRALPSALKDVILAEHEERMWFVVQRRYGLQRTEKLTLNEIGEAFGLTRERVRQIETKALGVLRHAFVEQDFVGKSFRVHPAILQSIHQIVGVLTTSGENVTRESSILLEIQAGYGEIVKRLWPEISLILTLASFERVEFAAADLEPVWVRSGSVNVEVLRRQVEELDRLLTVERALELDELDVLRHLNTRLTKKGAAKLTLLDLRQLKSICSSVEERPDGMLWGKFEHLKGRGNQVERLLSEAGEPLNTQEIARRLNHRLVKSRQRKVGLRNLVNQLIADSRFVAITRTGYWGLKAWPDIETATVVDLMEQCLITLDRPATSEEIYRFVSERRRVQRSSISIYLTADDRFCLMSTTTWGLASWPEAKTAVIWDRAQVASFLVRLFKDRKAFELPYAEVKQALAETMGVDENQAQGKLRANPILGTRKDAGSSPRVAFLRPEQIQKQVGGRTRSSSARLTGRELIRATVRRLLSTAPDQSMPLRDVVLAVQKELSSKEKTVYLYIREMDEVERVTLPESRVMICRLKTPPRQPTYPQSLQIATPELRTRVERAIPYLTADEIDLGLFLLSKEFEATLKDYVEAAVSVGRLPSVLGLDSSKWKLAGMVDLVAKEGLINDKSVLHLLREERNKSAHGSMPSLAERQVLMNNAPYLAALYIDYIALFDNLRRSL